jgi:hypothetical protein
MFTPIQQEKRPPVFDLRINLIAILSLGTLVFSAAFGLSKFETKLDHDADIQRMQSVFVRQDVNAVTDKELRDWMDRMEKKLDDIQRQQRLR